MKSEGTEGRKGRRVTGTLRCVSSELVTRGHPGRNPHAANRELCFQRKEMEIEQDANVGSLSTPSAPRPAVKT